jgi:hypothetical protein
MVPLSSLWLPILLSAVFVFIASSIIHMVIGYHRADFKRLPDEDGVMSALRPFALAPGDYMLPAPPGPSGMRDPAFLEKFKKGPVGTFTITKGGVIKMGPQLAQWFVYCLFVSVFAGYIASRGIGPGADYLRVSQLASATAFAAYALGHWQGAIWYKRSVGMTVRNTIDGLIYGFITGGTLGWLWPR